MEPIPHHLLQVPQKAEPGHIRSGMDPVAAADLRGCLVQGGHRLYGCFHLLRGGFPHSVGGADQPHAQSLGQDQPIPHLSGIVGVDPARVHQTGDRQSILDPGIRNGVPTCQDPACLSHFLCTTL